MKDFTHFILTRFNVKWHSTLLDKAWVEKRLDVFSKYCFPSVKSQTNQDFFWLVYFGEETLPEHRAAISNDFEKKYPNFKARYIRKLNDIDLHKDISGLCRNVPQYLITTRLDSDDCFSYNAIQKIQDQFAYQHLEVINFKKFYYYDFKYVTSKNGHSNNHISLIEKIGEDTPLININALDHSKISSMYPTKNIESEAILVRIIHDSNIMTEKAHGTIITPRELTSLKSKFLLFNRDHPPAPRNR